MTDDSLEQAVHDLRGPLGSLSIHVELLSGQFGDDPAPPAQRSIEQMRAAVDRLRRMLSEVVATGEVGAGPVVELDPANLLDELIDELAGQGPRGFVVDPPAAGISVIASSAGLRSALADVLRWLDHARPAEQPVDARWHTADDELLLSFDCSWTTQAAIQTAFALDPPGEQPGLFGAQAVLRICGGDAWASSSPDGAELVVSLPTEEAVDA